MTSFLDTELSHALANRLRMQIVSASVPVVEEWMDGQLDRWLESVPLPPELPTGVPAHFAMSFGSDLSRLTWSARGDPSGFVPKMADYFSECSASPDDVDMMGQVAEMVDPELVGSWVRVERGRLVTGWQFCDRRPLAPAVRYAGLGEARGPILGWAGEHGVEVCLRVSRALGDDSYTEIDVPLPTPSGAAVAAARDAFERLRGDRLPRHAERLAEEKGGLALSLRIAGERVVRAAIVYPELERDAIEAMCGEAGVPFDDTLVRFEGALDSLGAHEVELGRGEGGDVVDVCLVPHATYERPSERN